MKRLCWMTIAGLCFLLGAASFFPVFTLQVFRGDSGDLLLTLRLSREEKWEIRYIHSWYRVPQREIYRLSRGGEMILEEMCFGSYPAALYYDENPIQGFTEEGGWWKIKNIHQSLSHVHFKVGYTTDCRLWVEGKSIPFDSLAAPGESLVFGVKKMPSGKYLLSHLLGKERF